ncbi:hypothetical protein GCM10014715_63950 [Streptomyces spiralis]|uniref:Uncharacterized protein n=1 Tax=Streptomyces spiralis TaxID=66376 RepID=A0A919E112_9ACTN|nr:hypothetical protein [Streptomyces spiralis]GHE98970.1 hypothetical protein GCM10014715_63950 [Streptomyces spiralis]
MDTTAGVDPLLRITVADAPDALQSLYDWLRLEDEFRGRLRLAPSAPGTGGEMGGLLDVLTIALGSGGAGAVLARSLSTWLTHRHADVKVTVKGPDGRSVEVDAHLVRGDVPGLIREITRLVDGTEQQQ